MVEPQLTSAQPRPPKGRRVALKLLISLGLLAVCLLFVDREVFAATLRGFDWRLLIGASLLYVASQIAVGYRFELVLRALNRSIGVPAAIRYHLLSNWFNQVLPTSFGGEAVKVLMLRRRVGLRRGLRAVVANRLLGLLAVIVAALLVTAMAWASGLIDGMIALPALLVLTGGLLPLVAAAAPRLVRGLARPFLALPIVRQFVRLILIFAADLARTLAPARLRLMLLSSLGILALTFATLAVLGVGLGLGQRLDIVLWACPFMILAMHVPVSLGGWGTRELGTIVSFEAVGLAPELALALSISYGLANLLGSILGAGIAFLAHGDQPLAPAARAAATQKEAGD
jgi:glycosyltransferase 2 family protein